MESLAMRVAILFLIAFLAGPIAVALSAVRGKSLFLNVIRKILHGFFVAMSLWVGLMFFSNPDLPFVVNLIGLFGLIMGYIALRREYFPHFNNGPWREFETPLGTSSSKPLPEPALKPNFAISGVRILK